MKRTCSIRISLLIVALTAAAHAGMAVNFPAGVDISGTVGAPGYEQANWLNTANQPDSWGITYDLYDETAAPTGAVMDFWASAFGNQIGFSDDPMHARMLERGIGTWTDGVTYTPYDPATFRVIDIPYDQYDVVIYFGSREAAEYIQKVTVNGTTLYAKVPANTGYAEMGYRQIPDTSTSHLENDTPYGNYMVFKALTDATLVVEAAWAGGIGSLPRAYITGFQIVQDLCAGVVPTAEDLNGDCSVNLIDLSILAANWLATGAELM